MIAFCAPIPRGSQPVFRAVRSRKRGCKVSSTRIGGEDTGRVDVGKGGSGGDNSGNEGGGDGENRGEGESPEILKAILRDAGKKLHTLPPDLILAIDAGLMTATQLRNYLAFDASGFGWILRSFKSFRDRFLCDNQFVFKLLAQEVIGNGTSLAGEFIERGGHIVDELEYVLSDMVNGVFVEATFVWLLAARVPFPSLQSRSFSPLTRLIEGLPASVFERAGAGRSYSLMQRFASLLFVSAQYMAIGFGCGVVGTALTYALIKGRQVLQPEYEPIRSLPEVIPNSLGWGLFLATSSNFRFQVVEGMEISLARFLQKQELLLKGLIIALRFGNNLYGGVQFVQFFRMLGLQDTPGS